jgi:hypothetical protein
MFNTSLSGLRLEPPNIFCSHTLEFTNLPNLPNLVNQFGKPIYQKLIKFTDFYKNSLKISKFPILPNLMAVISKIHLLLTNSFQHSSKNEFLIKFYVFLLKTVKLKKLQFLGTAVNFLYRCKKSIQFV